MTRARATAANSGGPGGERQGLLAAAWQQQGGDADHREGGRLQGDAERVGGEGIAEDEHAAERSGSRWRPGPSGRSSRSRRRAAVRPPRCTGRVRRRATISATQGARTAIEAPLTPVSPLIATPARAKRVPASTARRMPRRAARRSERWPRARPAAISASPPSKPRIAATAKSEWLPPKWGTVSASSASPAPPSSSASHCRRSTGRRRAACDITARVTAPPASTAWTREIGAIERAATWISQATGGEAPAGGEPARAGQLAGAAQRPADLDRRHALAAAVLEAARRGWSPAPRRAQARSLSPPSPPAPTPAPTGRAVGVAVRSGPVAIGARRRAVVHLQPPPRGGHRRGGGAAGLGDRAVGALGRPSHLELDQPSAAQLGASVSVGAARRSLQRRLGCSLAPAGQAEIAFGGAGPAIGQRCRAAVEPAGGDAAAGAGPFAGAVAARSSRRPRAAATAARMVLRTL